MEVYEILIQSLSDIAPNVKDSILAILPEALKIYAIYFIMRLAVKIYNAATGTINDPHRRFS